MTQKVQYFLKDQDEDNKDKDNPKLMLNNYNNIE